MAIAKHTECATWTFIYLLCSSFSSTPVCSPPLPSSRKWFAFFIFIWSFAAVFRFNAFLVANKYRMWMKIALHKINEAEMNRLLAQSNRKLCIVQCYCFLYFSYFFLAFRLNFCDINRIHLNYKVHWFRCEWLHLTTIWQTA